MDRPVKKKAILREKGSVRCEGSELFSIGKATGELVGGAKIIFLENGTTFKVILHWYQYPPARVSTYRLRADGVPISGGDLHWIPPNQFAIVIDTWPLP